MSAGRRSSAVGGGERPVARRKARQLLKEGRRLLAKRGDRLTGENRAQLEADLGALAEAIRAGQREERSRLSARVDEVLDSQLGRYRKSVGREYIESILWAVAIALFIRAFFFEPFQIPTGSMIPSLHIGDHIFVSKFAYGVRIPWTGIRLFGGEGPERGEIVVFEYPGPGKDFGEDFIKRVVAVAGDRVRLSGDVLYVNGEPLYTLTANEGGKDSPDDSGPARIDELLWALAGGGSLGALSCNDEGQDYCSCVLQFEQNGDNGYLTQHHRRPCFGTPDWPRESSDCLRRPYDRDCVYFGAKPDNPDWPEVVIPADSVFCMGDNRDNSSDGRYWGVVPLASVKGRALIIWWAKDFARLFRLVQ